MSKIFHRFTFEKILKKLGAERVSKKASERFAEIVEKKTLEIAKLSAIFAKHAGRKTVLAEDVILAKKRVLV